jgi:hypothetical protein
VKKARASCRAPACHKLEGLRARKSVGKGELREGTDSPAYFQSSEINFGLKCGDHERDTNCDEE